jgi:hypothetical protein
MAEIFKSTSRFKNTEIINYEGHMLPGLMKKFDFLQREKLADDDILKIEIDDKMAGRPDLISNDIYGTTLFKWVLILFNNVTNPFSGWPRTGTTIEAPNNDAVWREL